MPWHQLEEDKFENEAPIPAVPNSLEFEKEKLADGEEKKKEQKKMESGKKEPIQAFEEKETETPELTIKEKANVQIKNAATEEDVIINSSKTCWPKNKKK
jgi:hypothetical protein